MDPRNYWSFWCNKSLHVNKFSHATKSTLHIRYSCLCPNSLLAISFYSIGSLHSINGSSRLIISTQNSASNTKRSRCLLYTQAAKYLTTLNFVGKQKTQVHIVPYFALTRTCLFANRDNIFATYVQKIEKCDLLGVI